MGGLFALSWITNVSHYAIDGIISRDGSYYYSLISKISTSNSFLDINELYIGHRIIPPIHLYFMYLMSKFGLDIHYAAIALNIVLAGFLPFLFYRISLELTHKETVSLLAAFFAAIHPVVVSLATEVQREILFILMIQLSFLFFLKIAKGKVFYLIPSAFLYAIGIFIRIEAFELFIVYIVVLVYWIQKGMISFQKSFAVMSLFLLIFVLTSLWIIDFFGLPVETYAKHYMDLSK